MFELTEQVIYSSSKHKKLLVITITERINLIQTGLFWIGTGRGEEKDFRDSQLVTASAMTAK